MRKILACLVLGCVAAGVVFHTASCGDDTCRLRLDSADEGDPIPVTVCATCNNGKNAQGGESVDFEFIANDPDVGCRCAGASCVFCKTDCDDEQCTVQVDTDEGTGCTEPAISLELQDEDFEEGARIPVTIRARSHSGSATRVVHLTRGEPTPTETITPTPTEAVPTATPTNTPLLGLGG